MVALKKHFCAKVLFNKYIVLDLGAESGRCIVSGYDSDKNKIVLDEVYRFKTPHSTINDEIYWNILTINDEIENSLILAVEQYGDTFSGVSIDTWGVDYVLLDADDRILGPVYNYRDKRTKPMLEEALKKLSKKQIFNLTGNSFALINTFFQVLSEKYKKHSLLDHASLILPIPSFLLYLLSGIKKAEYTIVSTTQLCDPVNRDWSWELISKYDLPKKIFPEIVEPGSILGPVQSSVVKKTGINNNTKIIASASHDTASAVVAIPSEDSYDWCFISSGTWSLIGAEIYKPSFDQKVFEYGFTNEGSVDGNTRLLKNISGLWILQECVKQWNKEGKRYSYNETVNLASEHKQCHSWIDVDDERFFTPGDMVQKISTFLSDTDQVYKDDDGWIILCILESLAFKYRITVKQIEEILGKQFSVLHMVGGGTRNKLLCDLTTNATGKKLICGPIEGTAVGNLGMQMIATGEIENVSYYRKLVRDSFDLEYFTPIDSQYWSKNEDYYIEHIIK